LRILHLGKFFPPYPGGIERHLADLGMAQAAAGAEAAALVHATPHDRSRRRWRERGLLVDAVPCHGQLVFAPLSPAWPLHLQRLLREFRPDLLHVHVPNPSAFWLFGSRAARRLPWVVHWHADIPHDSGRLGLRLGYPLYRRFERALNARAARIVATSAPYLQASTALRQWRERCRVIPLGIGAAPPPQADAPEWPAPGMRVLAVGRLSYYKGFDVLLDALARVPSASLLLIGDGELRAPLRAQAERLGLGARVRFAGKVDDATLEAAYRACDVFCLPSIDRAEAFGIVLLEAMRAGRALLASDIPGSGVGSVVRAGETGELVPPRDADALARSLAGLAADPARRAAYGAAARERWARDYRIDAVTQQWLALYRDVLASPTAG
jgi:glycosyltransferase involved in cell wall biosynthesis